MKYAGLLLAFFLCFVAVNGFCGGKKDANASDTADLAKQLADKERDLARSEIALRQEQERNAQLQEQVARLENKLPLVPITREIVAQVNKYRHDLNKLNYHLSMNLILTVNRNETGVSLSDEGRIRFTERNTPRPIRISATTVGKKESDAEQDALGKDRWAFEIAFPDENEPSKRYYLKFVRNDKNNSFDLDSVESDGTIYGFTFDGVKPHLCVYYEYISDDSSRIEVQGQVSGIAEDRRAPIIEVIPEVSESSESAIAEVDADSTQLSLEQSEQPQLSQAEDSVESGSIAASESMNSRNMNSLGDMFVMGEGSLKVDPVAEYIWSKNRDARLSDIKEVIRIYIDESRQEGVNSDLAIAQMCHATDYLKNVRFYNYAGFSWDNIGIIRFSSQRDGVVAHIQHLKGYASSEPPREPIKDQRFDILGKEGLANTVKTFDELLAKWAPRPDYGNDIKDKLKLLYQVSDSQI